jgi:ATP-dependent DNA helicase RecG
MHRSYRVHQPTQVIRYRNRVEIKNAGFSLKNEDSLGETGSQLRNPSIAAIFHETNTAETKGSGIRTMRRLMKEHGFSPPTFESNRGDNFFVSRLLLHHFLSETDLVWLKQVESPLSDPQRIALIFLREQGAIDNQTLRQLTDCDVLTASSELRKLRDGELVEQKGRGSATYYVPGSNFPDLVSSEGNSTVNSETTNMSQHGTLRPEHSTLESEHGTLESEHGTLENLMTELPGELQAEINALGGRPGQKIRQTIRKICKVRAFNISELAEILGKKNPHALKKDHLRPMIRNGELVYVYPDMEKHPYQAYQTPKDQGE